MRGFSIVEVVLMIAVLAILGVAALLMSPDISPARVIVAARQVQSDIEYAKRNAMTTGVVSGAQFVNGGAYTVYQNTTATPLKSPLTKQNMVITLSSTYPGVGISNNYTVEFNNFGAPTAGGGGTVTVSDGTNSKIIAVTANTGSVKIQ